MYIASLVFVQIQMFIKCRSVPNTHVKLGGGLPRLKLRFRKGPMEIIDQKWLKYIVSNISPTPNLVL